MKKRTVILAGMTGGMVWAIGLVAWAVNPWTGTGGQDRLGGAVLAAFIAGLPLLLMIGRLAQRRFFDDSIIDGQAFAPGSGAEIDQKVLTNTVEQMILAAAIWPLAVVQAHGFTPVWLALGFAVARILFWIGYHVSPPLRGLGFAATFYPTIVAGIWGVWAILS